MSFPANPELGFMSKPLRCKFMELVAGVLNEVPFEFLDEVIDEFRQQIADRTDEMHRAPVSALMYAEDHRRLNKVLSTKKYKVKIRKTTMMEA